MNINKTNRAFMYKKEKGKYVVYMNVEGEQRKIVLYPEIADDGEGIGYWSGPIYVNDDAPQEETA